MGVIRAGQPVIDTTHQKIHEGRAFIVTDVDTDVDIAGPKYYRFTTPNTDVEIHFVFSVFCNAAAVIQFYENPTINAAGTEMTAYNMYRDNSQSATLTARYDCTTTSDGTLIYSGRVGTSGVPVSNSGGVGGSRHEFILKQNEDYVLKITTVADNNATAVDFTWYEVLEK